MFLFHFGVERHWRGCPAPRLLTAVRGVCDLLTSVRSITAERVRSGGWIASCLSLSISKDNGNLEHSTCGWVFPLTTLSPVVEYTRGDLRIELDLTVFVDDLAAMQPLLEAFAPPLLLIPTSCRFSLSQVVLHHFARCGIPWVSFESKNSRKQ